MKKILLPVIFLLCLFPLSIFSQDAEPGELISELTSKKGQIVYLEITDGVAPVKGTNAKMFKYFEEKMGMMTMTGWLEVAKVEFIETADGKCAVKILEEKSDITVDDEKVDHFKVGKVMKLQWPYVEEESEE